MNWQNRASNFLLISSNLGRKLETIRKGISNHLVYILYSVFLKLEELEYILTLKKEYTIYIALSAEVEKSKEGMDGGVASNFLIF